MFRNRRKSVVSIGDIPSLNEDYDEMAQSLRDPLFPANERWSDRISLWAGDMTTLQTDAIVNAANTSLLGGGGIDGAIHNAAGSQLLQECRGLKGCETGKAKITKGYNLPAKHVIHTVGPIGEKPDALKSCYNSVLDIVRDNKLSTVAFCCISTGIYGYDNGRAARVALETVRKWLDENHEDAMKIERIIFCVFLSKDDQIYRELLPLYFPKAKITSRSEQEKQEESESVVNAAKEDANKLSSAKAAPLETQAGDGSASTTAIAAASSNHDKAQSDLDSQGSGAPGHALEKTVRRSISEESLDKRKAEDDIVKTDTPNKKPGGSKRNSTDFENEGDTKP
ncbi:O-acetyl-ADP-ribose deacetylase [Entomortierella parvispora]|uniref:O-acetyl-ADP-ribose deacetylase n=1 Tax=Entomortierella parvispora TaxID=205924 RepID=A0A9P3LZN4_9FUNG|nr:O-acetyl-ADP-ribose deacetylase [Entomortierella parvispora]